MENGREDKLPWVKWYWSDYRADEGLRLCSLAAQGLWMRMLSVMADSRRKGYLLLNGRSATAEDLSDLTHSSVEEIQKLTTELRFRKVFSETKSGLIYNRRMAKANHIFNVRSKAGAKGGRPRNQGEIGLFDEKQNESKTEPLSASASVSASASNSSSNKEGGVGETDLLFEELWKSWPNEGRFKKDYCHRKFAALVVAGKLEEYKATHRGYLQYLESQEIDRNFKQRTMHLSTFLNNWEGDKERYVNFRRTTPL